MSKIRVTSNPMQSGRNGANTYYVTKGTQIVRPSKNNSNYGADASRTPNQQARRIMWANLVNLYKVSSFWMPKAFENAKGNQSDYNVFMGLNMDKSLIAFTKSEASLGACVAEGVQISLGSLPTIAHTKTQAAIATSIQVGNDITLESSVADFSKALVANNPQVYEGMQLSFLYYMQSLDALGIPRVQCFAYEVTLDFDDDTRLVQDVFPSEIVAIDSGFIYVNLNAMEGACCFIWSETTNRGKIKVSSQNLIPNNDYLITVYSSDVQYEKAMESYGVDVGVFLQKGYYSRSGGRPVIEVMIETYIMIPTEYKIGTMGPTYSDMLAFEGLQGLGLASAVPVGTYEVTLTFLATTPSIMERKLIVQGRVTSEQAMKFVQIDEIPQEPELSGLQLARASFVVGTAEYVGWWAVRG